MENMNTQELKEILEWYICAGVEETAGDEPFAQVLPTKSISPLPARETASQKTQSERPATTVLSQAVNDACQNARQQCQNINTLEELKKLVEGFDGCALKLTASNTVFGEGSPKARVIFIGEAPGADEDRMGRPFVGKSGQLLDKMMSAVGLNRENCYITNVLPWRPPGNRTPTDGEVAVCLPLLLRQIEIIKPDFLFLMGASAAGAVLNVQDSISRLRGHWLEYQGSDGCKIECLASFHPAYLLRNPAQKAKAWTDFLRLKQKLEEKS